MKDADFERLVRLHAQDVYAFLVYRIGDRDVAEEVLADTLERAYRARSRFDRRRASEKTWLISIALNRWRDLMRREQSERAAIERLGSGAPVEAGSPDVIVERHTLLSALEELPPDERDVVTLMYGADLTAKQVARVLAVPVTTVNGRLYRGLKRLRETLREELSPGG